MTNSIQDLMRDKIKSLQAENAALRQQLSAATQDAGRWQGQAETWQQRAESADGQLKQQGDRLAAAERCVEFFFGCQVQVDIPNTCVGFTALRDGRFASTRWKLNDDKEPIRRQEFNIRDNAIDAWLDAEAANWLPAEPQQQGGG